MRERERGGKEKGKWKEEAKEKRRRGGKVKGKVEG